MEKLTPTIFMHKNKEVREYKADSLKRVFNSLRPYPIRPGSIYHVDLSKVRSDVDYIKRAKNNLESSFEGDLDYRCLLIGHKSCGKSTELLLLAKDVEDKYAVVSIEDIEKQQSQITEYADLVYFVAEHLVLKCQDDPNMSKASIRELTNLKNELEGLIYTKVKLEKSEAKQASVALETELGAGTPALFKGIFNCFIKIKGKGLLEDSTKKILTTEVRNNLSTFIDLLNDLILSIQGYLRNQNKRLLIIIDGLDKLSPDVANKLFMQPDSPILSLDCSLIITCPLFLSYDVKFKNAIEHFTDKIFFRMIKIRNKDKSPYKEGISALTELLSKRMDLELFESHDVYELAIEKCGGIIRDLFTIVSNAALYALQLDCDKINVEHIHVAFRELVSDYRRCCYQNDYDIFKEIWGKEIKDAQLSRTKDNAERIINLFERGLLIEYNGEGWYDVHPAVAKMLESTRTD